MSEEKTIEQLLTEERETKAKLLAAMEQEKADNEEARQIMVKAENRVIDARNVYDWICKRIDAAMGKLREASPTGSAWDSRLPV